MYCPKCGAQNADNNKFCYQCGFNLESYNPQTRIQGEAPKNNGGSVKSQPVIVPPEAKRPKKSRKGIIVLFSILAFVIIATTVVRYEREKERRAVQTEINYYTEKLNVLQKRQAEQENIKKMCQDILDYYRDEYDPKKRSSIEKLSSMGTDLNSAVSSYSWADSSTASAQEVIGSITGDYEKYIRTVEEYRKNILGEIISTAKERQEIDKKLILLQVHLSNL